MNSLITADDWKQIAETVINYRMTCIISPTGTGKTLGVPIALANLAKDKGIHNFRIYVVLPTSFAVHLAYQAQCDIQSSINGVEVGYAAEKQRHNVEKANIIYVTSNYFLNLMLNFIGKQNDVVLADAVMLDEIHVGSLDYQIIMSLWEALLANNRDMALSSRLLLSSAILDPRLLAPLYEPGRSIPNINLHPKETNVVNYYTKYTEDNLYSLTRYTLMAGIVWDSHLQPNLTGNFLVFLPGKSQIKHVRKILNDKMAGTQAKKMVILDVFGGMPAETRKKIISLTISDERTIILATPVAEHSITIPGITLVVDSMVAYIPKSRNTSGIHLSLGYISQASAIQRSGRAGRTTNSGVCIRMCSEETYNNLSVTQNEESHRIPLHRSIIKYFKHKLDRKLDPTKVYAYSQLKDVKKDVRNIASLILSDHTPDIMIRNISGAISNLYRRDIIVYQNNNLVTSDLGYFVSLFDLSVDNSTILWHLLFDISNKVNGALFYPSVALVCMIDCYSGFGGQGYWQTQGNRENLGYSMFNGENDIHVLLNIWKKWMGYWVDKNRPEKYKNAMSDWTNNNRIHFRKLSDVWSQIKDVIFKLRKYNQNMVQTYNQSKWPEMNLEAKSWSESDSVQILISFKNILREHYDDRLLISENTKLEPNKPLFFTNIYNHKYRLSVDRSIVQYSGDNQPNVLYSLLDMQQGNRYTVLLGFLYYEQNIQSSTQRLKNIQNKDYDMLLGLLENNPVEKKPETQVSQLPQQTITTIEYVPKNKPIAYDITDLEYDIPAFLLDDDEPKNSISTEIDPKVLDKMVSLSISVGDVKPLNFVDINMAKTRPIKFSSEVAVEPYDTTGTINVADSMSVSNIQLNIENKEMKSRLDEIMSHISNLKSSVSISEFWNSLYKLLQWRDQVVRLTKERKINLPKNKWYNILARSFIDYFAKSNKYFWDKLLSEYDKQTRPQKIQGRQVLIDAWTETKNIIVPVMSPIQVTSEALIMEPYRMKTAKDWGEYLKKQTTTTEELIRLFGRYIFLVPYEPFWYHNPDIDEYLVNYFDQIHYTYATPFTHENKDVSYQSLFAGDKVFGARKLKVNPLETSVTINIVPRTEKMVARTMKAAKMASEEVNLWILPYWKGLNTIRGISVNKSKMLNTIHDKVELSEDYWIAITGKMHEKTRQDHLRNIQILLQNLGKLKPVYGYQLISANRPIESLIIKHISPRYNQNNQISNIGSPRSIQTSRPKSELQPIILPKNYLSPSQYKAIPNRRLFILKV